MTVWTDLVAAANAAVDESVNLNNQVTTLSRTAAQAATRIGELQSQVADLEAQLAAGQAAQGTLYGMNVSPGSSFTNGVKETAQQQGDRIRSTYGGLPVCKYFYSGALPAKYNAANEGQAPVTAVCFKPNQDALANGSLDAAIRGYLDSVPSEKKVLLVNWQEPDDEMWKSNLFTSAQHKAATDHLCDVVHAHAAGKDGRAEVWDCYMGFSLDVNRFDWNAVSPKLDGIGWDRYWNNANGHPENSAAQMKQMADLTKSHGIKKYAIFETGDNPTTFADGKARATFWSKVYDDAGTQGYSYICYFNAIGTTGDHRMLPGQAYSDPAISVLKGHMS
jgi:hypothetical protein